jgi:predicted NUDIX family NTP pyrophosphohydrolase
VSALGAGSTLTASGTATVLLAAIAGPLWRGNPDRSVPVPRGSLPGSERSCESG